MYTDGLIQELIDCEKEIVDPPPREFKKDRRQLKKNFTLRSLGGEYSFNAFIRVSTHFNENFSIGLDYNPKEEKGTICLLRCNGAHGENNVFPFHVSYHIHRASAETINKGLKPESNIENSDAYASFEEAIQFFIKEINVKLEDRRKHFPEPNGQYKLNFNNE